MTDFQDVVDAWDTAARSPLAQQHIHPSGRSAEEYERSGRAQAAEVFEIVDRFHVKTTSRLTLLDFGCGDGRVSRHLTNAFGVIGADASPTMVGRFREDTALDACVWDGTGEWHGPMPDVIIAFAVFIHHDHESGAALLKSLASIVNPDGLVLVDIPVYDVARDRSSWCDVTVWTMAELDQAAEDAGLIVDLAWRNEGTFSFDNIGSNHGRLHVLRA